MGPVYRPRNPRQSPLYRCVRRHVPELEQADAFRRCIEKQVLERFVACGDLHRGVARIHCDGCGHDYLLAYSCKTRVFARAATRIGCWSTVTGSRNMFWLPCRIASMSSPWPDLKTPLQVSSPPGRHSSPDRE